MAEQAVIGNPYVFQILLLDASNDPVVPTVGPTISIFSFSTSGVKNPLVTAAAMTAGVPAETGRYVYAYTVPVTFTDGEMLYGEMVAEDALGTVYRYSWEVDLIAATRSGAYNNAGLSARFVP